MKSLFTFFCACALIAGLSITSIAQANDSSRLSDGSVPMAFLHVKRHHGPMGFGQHNRSFHGHNPRFQQSYGPRHGGFYGPRMNHFNRHQFRGGMRGWIRR